MIDKFLHSIISCLGAMVKCYPAFIMLLGLEVFLKIMGISQYSLVNLVRFFIENSQSINASYLVIRLIISILVSMFTYISICYFVYRNLYKQMQLKISFKKLFKRLWFKLIVIMAFVLVPLRLIIEIINNNTRIDEFMGYFLIFVFVVLKSIVFFLLLGLISNKIVNEDMSFKYSGFVEMLTRLIILFVCVMVVASPISFLLGKLEYNLFIDQSNILTVINLVNIIFKTFYNVFIFMYIIIGVFENKNILIRSNHE